MISWSPALHELSMVFSVLSVVIQDEALLIKGMKVLLVSLVPTYNARKVTTDR